ncbi:MAG: hypothetical protein QOJ10_574 [Chloroflexota bacterium]|nr:hypothetical protein [Chloroflexota bacterium]
MPASKSSTRAPLTPFQREWWRRCRGPPRLRQTVPGRWSPQRRREPPRAAERRPAVRPVGAIQRRPQPAQRRRRRALRTWPNQVRAGQRAVAPTPLPAAARAGSERKAPLQARPTTAQAAPRAPRSSRHPTTKRLQARSTTVQVASAEAPAGLPAVIPNRWRLVQASPVQAGRRPRKVRAAPSHQRRTMAAPAARRAAIPKWEPARLELEVVARRDAAPAERPVREAAAGPRAPPVVARPRLARAVPGSRPSLAPPAAAQVVAPMRVEAAAPPRFGLQAGWVPEAPASLRARQGPQAPVPPRSPRRVGSTQAPGRRVEAAQRRAAARLGSPRSRVQRRAQRPVDPSSARRQALERWSERRGWVHARRLEAPTWWRCRQVVATEQRPSGLTEPAGGPAALPSSAWSGGGV